MLHPTLTNETYIAEDVEKTAEYVSSQNIEQSVEAGHFAHRVLDEILAFVRPGIRESEVKNFAFSRYEFHELQKPWHMPYIRFGEHTLLTYRDKAKEDIVLQETDIAFVDIGIVKNGIEGDAGRTIAFGADENFQKLVEASKEVFVEATNLWREKDPTGIDLYVSVNDIIRRHGFMPNLETAGHLIGAYPHKGWKYGLNRFPAKAAKGAWVLEIQMRHPELPCGAFFEDLLI